MSFALFAVFVSVVFVVNLIRKAFGFSKRRKKKQTNVDFIWSCRRPNICVEGKHDSLQNARASTIWHRHRVRMTSDQSCATHGIMRRKTRCWCWWWLASIDHDHIYRFLYADTIGRDLRASAVDAYTCMITLTNSIARSRSHSHTHTILRRANRIRKKVFPFWIIFVLFIIVAVYWAPRSNINEKHTRKEHTFYI